MTGEADMICSKVGKVLILQTLANCTLYFVSYIDHLHQWFTTRPQSTSRQALQASAGATSRVENQGRYPTFKETLA
ncbi:hypothetical protein CEP54_006665 [Fusarium duplospermum]|uniref:Uncharacterized protein n=1 Tax=Fusarium duplospermum TaxID=1325734 RepID=A0A428Q5N0_9HYPO|nr:hypothetical protein CEP54_006665 [Fusarium duplospermum]